MKTIRLALSAFVMLGLLGGYLASQSAYFGQTAPAYAQKVDQPVVRWVALLVLLLCIVFAFIKDKDDQERS